MVKNAKPNIVVNRKEYVYQQIVVVSKHAPVIKIDITKLDNSSSINNPVIDNDVLRICRPSQESADYCVLTGFNKVLEARQKEQVVISGKLVTISYLERCLVPPKALSHDELQQKLTSETFTQTGIKIRVGKQNKSK